MHPVVPAFRCLFSDDGPAKETNEETEDKEEAGEKETEQTRGDIKHYETPPSPRPPSPLREWQRLPAPGTSASVPPTSEPQARPGFLVPCDIVLENYPGFV